MIGETASIELTFDNIDATDAGFGPFIDFYLPVNGADGVNGAGVDGFSYVLNSANYLATPLVTTVLTFPNDGGGVGSVDHPYAVDASGTALPVSGAAGDQLLVFQLPFGSFTADQPAATMNFDVQLSNLADLATPLTFAARSGFQFGNDALDNPDVDPTTLSNSNANAQSWTPTSAPDTRLIELEKIYVGEEDETASGPNFARQYRINVNIADGQTITQLDITDALPNNVELVSVDLISPSGTTTNLPATPANTPNNLLTVRVPSVVGTAADVDASLLFTYIIPFRDADSVEVIDPSSGDDAISQNEAFASGQWTPLDTPRDSAVIATADPAGFEHILTPKSIATQKSVVISNNQGGADFSAGDTLLYTIDFQVSDFFAFENVFLLDTLSDGQRFNTSAPPTLTLTEHGSTSSGNIDAANIIVTDNFSGAGLQDGTQQIQFNISNELVTRTLGGQIHGGLVPTSGTGGGDPSSGTFDLGATQGTLTFEAIIQDSFDDDFPSGDASIDEGDQLRNDATITGDLLDYRTNVPTTQSESDTSFTEFEIATGTLTKSIYAINGNTTLPSPLQISPGDSITYQLISQLPSSDFEQLAFRDFLPLPVLLASEVTTFVDTVDASVPAAGSAKFGPSDTLRGINGAVPAMSFDTGANSLLFDFGSFDDPLNQISTVDLLFTVTAQSAPFADGLQLTNQVRRVQDATNAPDISADAIIQIELREPELHLTKGVVATNNPNAIFAPTDVGPVAFSAPGSAGFRGAATINSAGLAGFPIDSNASSLDADDLVTFAIVIENRGTSRLGAFDIQFRDTLPAGFAVPGTGLNLSITDGTGAALPFTTLGTGLFDATGGIELDDPGATAAIGDGTNAGTLDEFDNSDGQNILVLTYDLQVESDASPLDTLENTATLFNYAGANGGVDFTSVDSTDVAQAIIQATAISKSIISTNLTHTANEDVAIGEIVTYRSTLTVPEGVSDSFVWTDTPDSGLAIVDVLSVTGSAALSSSAGTFAAIAAAATIPANGSSVTLDFDTLTNSDTDNLAAETITIDYRAVVLNSAGNNRTQTLDNSAEVTWTGGSRSADADDLTIVEPLLNVAKSITPNTREANETVAVSLTLTHTANSDANAFDVVLSDIMPTGLAYAGGLTFGGQTPDSSSDTGGNVVASYNTFALGASATIQFNATVGVGATPGENITNDASATWTSIAGDVTTAQSSNPQSVERTGDTSDPGGARNDYLDTGSDSVTIASPTPVKSITLTDQLHTSGNDVAIGEVVNYTVSITVPQGTMPGTTLVDTPDTGLSIVDVLSVTSNSTSVTTSSGTLADVATNAVIAANGTSVTFDFGTLVNSDTNAGVAETLTVVYRAVVLNASGNDRGQDLDNSGELRWNAGSTAAFNATDLTILEPELSISAVPSVTTADAGDTVRYTVTLSHSIASDADAFNVSLENLINSVGNHLAYVPSTLSITNAGGATLDSSSDSAGDLAAIWSNFPQGATATIEFDVQVQNSAPANTGLDNVAGIEWTSLPGDVSTPISSSPNSVERTGDTANNGGTENDHRSNATATVSTPPPDLEKSIVATSSSLSGQSEHDPTATDLLIGETVTYSIVASLPEGTNTLAVFDQLPFATNQLEFVSASVGRVGSNLTVPTPTQTSSDTNGDLILDRVELSFGSVLNTPDGITNADDEIEVLVTARLIDSINNQNGDQIINDASVDVSGSTSTATAAIDVVAPVLDIAKSSTPNSAPPGSTIPYTIQVQHNAASTAGAYDLAISDLLSDTNLELIPGTVSTSHGSITSGNATGDSTLGVSIPELLQGDIATVTFQAIVNPSIGSAGVSITNSANVNYDNQPGTGGRVASDLDSNTFTTTTPAIDLAVTKVSNIDPAVINRPFSYVITVTNLGPSTATGVTATDAIPASLTIESIVVSQGTFNLVGSSLTANLGTLLPNGDATITVNVTAPSTEQTLLNTVNVSANEADGNAANDQAIDTTEVVGVSTIAGATWIDTNSNGIQETDEQALPGVAVRLLGTDIFGAAVDLSITSDLAGNYRFVDIMPGNYQVLQNQPLLFIDNADYLGSAGGTLGSDQFSISLAAGVDEVGYNFTELGLNPAYLGKRGFLGSILQAGGLDSISFEVFYTLLEPLGVADLNGDTLIDNSDLAIFQQTFGSASF
ncbi:MAG: beta strand repeat-containing protein [Pirellulaceae bacterium]